ncbi:hypothetical protein F2Q70_00002348 [Brassica cretica]|uniref:Uncharacterized protein n=1 Tax=Brassica cretica TaxID=69181 RepID=A0A8S9J2R4_BRACR|nr:hypothetical protein F2Q70_00002348 [Brassica cretica]KAF3564239.1 hypothetical protein DY000_02013758 [Brassica cretica]
MNTEYQHEEEDDLTPNLTCFSHPFKNFLEYKLKESSTAFAHGVSPRTLCVTRQNAENIPWVLLK